MFYFFSVFFLLLFYFAGHGNHPVVEKSYRDKNSIMTLRKHFGKISKTDLLHRECLNVACGFLIVTGNSHVLSICRSTCMHNKTKAVFRTSRIADVHLMINDVV